MFIEVKGANFVNKGAELMLLAIVQATHNNFKLVVDPNTGTYLKRAELGLYQKLSFKKSGSHIIQLLELLPGLKNKFNKLKYKYGLVSDRDIDIVLDASGFAYSDQWGPKPSETMARLVVKWKKQGVKIIMLPQAFGPFKNPRTQKAIKEITENVDLIFAREHTSYKHLVEIAGELSHIKIAPDFTCLVNGSVPDYYQPDSRRVFIIPNYRMIDKMTAKASENYVKLLEYCIKFLIEEKYNPVFLIHDTGKDFELANNIRSQIIKEIEIIQENNPLFIKGMLGNCYAVIGSRFHGLINALSQGVPCIAMGWSHKYEMLFQDFGCPECLISTSDNVKLVEEKLFMLINENKRGFLIKKIEESAKVQQNKTREMWNEVFGVITSP